MADTLDNLEAAIQAHIAAVYEGSYVDSWILVTHSQTVSEHQTSNYRIVTPSSQPIHVDSGLVATGKLIIRDSWDSSWDDGDD